MILVTTWNDGLFAVMGDHRTQELASQPTRGLAPDERGGALAIVSHHLLRRLSPDGHWTTFATSDSQLACCIAVQDVIYVGTEDARMLRLEPTGVLEPIEGFGHVAGRDDWFAGSAIVNGQRLGPPLGIRSLAANSNGSVLFANVHVGGIPRSLDRGISWQPTIDIHADVHEVRAHPTNPQIVAAASVRGLCISRDAGATWTIEHDGLHAPHCAAVAFSGDNILVSAATDPFTQEGKIYRRSVALDGSILPAFSNGSTDTNCIATNGSIVAVADRAGALYLSTDFGAQWSQIADGLPTPSSVLIF